MALQITNDIELMDWFNSWFNVEFTVDSTGKARYKHGEVPKEVQDYVRNEGLKIESIIAMRSIGTSSGSHLMPITEHGNGGYNSSNRNNRRVFAYQNQLFTKPDFESTDTSVFFRGPDYIEYATSRSTTITSKGVATTSNLRVRGPYLTYLGTTPSDANILVVGHKVFARVPSIKLGSGVQSVWTPVPFLFSEYVRENVGSYSKFYNINRLLQLVNLKGYSSPIFDTNDGSWKTSAIFTHLPLASGQGGIWPQPSFLAEKENYIDDNGLFTLLGTTDNKIKTNYVYNRNKNAMWNRYLIDARLKEVDLASGSLNIGTNLPANWTNYYVLIIRIFRQTKSGRLIPLFLTMSNVLQQNNGVIEPAKESVGD